MTVPSILCTRTPSRLGPRCGSCWPQHPWDRCHLPGLSVCPSAATTAVISSAAACAMQAPVQPYMRHGALPVPVRKACCRTVAAHACLDYEDWILAGGAFRQCPYRARRLGKLINLMYREHRDDGDEMRGRDGQCPRSRRLAVRSTA